MNNWVLLHAGEHPPTLAPEQFICLAMEHGGILRVMYRFVKNMKGTIAGYLIEDATTSAVQHVHGTSHAASLRAHCNMAHAIQHERLLCNKLSDT